MSLIDIETKYGKESFTETFEGPEVDLDEDEIDEPIVSDNELTSVIRDAEDIDKATIAVESYLQILTQREKQGLALTEDIAKIMRVGLEAIDPEFFYSTVISVENVLEGELVDDDDVETGYGARETNSENSKFRDSATEKTKSGFLDRLKKLMEAAFEALKRVFQATLNLYHNVVTNVDKMVEKINEVAKRSTVLEGGHKFKMRGLGRLSIDGKFVGDDPRQYENLAKVSGTVLHDVTAFAYKNTIEGYKEVIEILKDKKKLTQFLKTTEHNADDISSRLWTIKGNLLNTQEKILKALSSKLTSVKNLDVVPKDILSTFTMIKNGKTEQGKLSVPMKSETLMGDKAFYAALPSSDLDISQAIFKMGLFAVPDTKTDLGFGEESLTTINARDAISILGNIKGLINSLGNYKNEFSKIDREMQSIVRSGSEVSRNVRNIYNSDSKSIVGNNAADIVTLVQTYNRTLRNATQANWGFIGYLFATSKAAVAMINQMVEVEGVKEGETVANKKED